MSFPESLFCCAGERPIQLKGEGVPLRSQSYQDAISADLSASRFPRGGFDSRPFFPAGLRTNFSLSSWASFLMLSLSWGSPTWWFLFGFNLSKNDTPRPQEVYSAMAQLTGSSGLGDGSSLGFQSKIGGGESVLRGGFLRVSK